MPGKRKLNAEGVLVLSIRGRKERKIAFVLPQKRSWHNTLVVFPK